MPQPGERRSGATETVEWDGSRWHPVAGDGGGENPHPWINPSPQEGYHPSVSDSNHPWLAAMKGLLSGSSEAATPGKVGALASIAMAPETFGLSIPAGAAVAGGTTAALDLMRSHFGTGNAPKSGNEFVGDVVGSAAIPAVGGAIGKGASMLGDAVGHRKVGTALGAATGGYEGYQHGGVPGAVVGAVTGGAAGAFGQTKFQKLAKLFGIGEEAAAAPAAEELGGFAPGASRGRSTSTPISHNEMSGDIPDYSGRAPGYDPHLVDPTSIKTSTQVDRFMPNSTAHTNPAGIDLPEAVRGVRDMQDFQYDGNPDVGQMVPSGQGFSEPAAIKIEAGGGNKGKQAAASLKKLLGVESSPTSPSRRVVSPQGDVAAPSDVGPIEQVDPRLAIERGAGITLSPEARAAYQEGQARGAAQYSGPERREFPDARRMLDSLISSNGDNPALTAIRGRMDGTHAFDAISGQTVPVEDLPQGGLNLDSMRVGREAPTAVMDAPPAASEPDPESLNSLRDMLLQDPSWSSGAESGSPESAIAGRMHREQFGNDARLRYLWNRDQ